MALGRKQLPTFVLEDYKVLDQLHYERQVMIVEHTTTAKKYVMKSVELPAGLVNPQAEAEKVGRLVLSNFPLAMRPELFCVRQEATGHRLCLLQPRMPISLQKILAIYREKSAFLSRRFVQSFLQGLFNMVWKLNEQRYYHGNLKPTNVFWKDGTWHVSECGIFSVRINKYYAKGYQPTFDKVKSLQYCQATEQMGLGLERDLYSLGVMALEMMSMQNIATLHSQLTNRQNKSDLKHTYDGCAKRYGVETSQFVKSMIEGGPAPSRQAYKRFKNNQSMSSSMHVQNQPEQQIRIQSYMSSEYGLALPELDELLERIRANKESCLRTLQSFHSLDEQLSFQLPTVASLSNVLEGSYGYSLPFERLIELWEYFTTASQMRYINILKQIYPLDEVIKAIMTIVSKGYDRPKDFFEQYNGGKDFWNAAAFKSLLDTGEIDVSPDQLRTIIRQWNKDQKREYLTYKQFCKVFALGQSNAMMDSAVKEQDKRNSANMASSQKAPAYENELTEMLNLLQLRVPNMSLFRFFRDHDQKMRWVCESTIERNIRDKIRMPEDKLKKALEQMWASRAGIPGEHASDRRLKYLVLLVDSKMEKPADLFKLVLTDKINLLDFAHFFEKYKLNKEGWTLDSLMEINKDQQLEFHERDLRQFFKQLDKDESGSISEKELKEKLTGLKEFSESVYVENLKQYASANRTTVPQLFFKQDPSMSLQFRSTGQLQAVFDQAKISLSPEHCQELFLKYCNRDKFEYVDFLKQFYVDELDQLFKLTLVFVMKGQYDGDFQRVYQMGLSGKRTKWDSKSLQMVNDQMVLGFTEAELRQIWRKLDSKDDQSLSKTEIARLFDIKFERETYEPEEQEPERQQIVKKKSETPANNKDLFPGVTKKKAQSRASIKEPEKELTVRDKMLQEIDNNDILRELYARRKKRDLLTIFFEQDNEQRFSLSYREFEAALNQLDIEVKKGAINMYTKNFQFETSDKEVRINFIKLILYFDSLEKEEGEAKSATILALLRKFMRVRKCSIDDLLASGRNKNKWTVSSLESFLSKSLDSQIYYDDIELVWEYWNCGRELDRNELIEILQKGTVEGKTNNPARADQRKEESRGPGKVVSLREEESSSPISDLKKRRNSKKHEQYDENWTLNQGAPSPVHRKDYVIEQVPSDDHSSDSPKRKSSMQEREKAYGLRGKRQSLENSEKDYDSGKVRVEDRALQRERYPARDTGKSSPQRKGSDKNFKIKGEGEISFMKPNEDTYTRRAQIDEQNVKYTTDKSEEIGWGGMKQTIHRERSRQRPPEPPRADRKKQKEVQQEMVRLLSKHSFKELEKFATRQKLQSGTFQEILVSKYRMKKDQAELLGRLYSKNGRVSLPQLKEIVSTAVNPNQAASLSPRAYSSFKQSTNNLATSQNLSAQKRPKLNNKLIRQHISILMSQFAKKSTVSDMPYFFFGKGDLINLDRFIEKCEDINRNISKQMFEQIFSYMNPIKGEISLISFRTAFHQTSDLADELQFPPDLEKQVKELFTKADKDKSGSISKEQLPQLLGNFGLNMTIKEIQGFFKDLDKDKSGAIDLLEFKEFLARAVFPQLSNFQEVVDLLRKELRNADLFSCGGLESQQLSAALTKLGVPLSPDELVELGRQFGRQGRINIEQLLMQVANVSNCKQRNIIRMALFKIRFLKRITIKDIKATFSRLSSCFTLSYTFQLMRELSLMPSTSLRPKLDSSGLFYNDYFYTNINSIDPTKPCLERVARYNQLVLELRFDQATGIPIPLETAVARNSILRRSLNISFFDSSQEKSKDAMCSLQATWDPDLQDVWKFTTEKGFDRAVYVKVGDFEENKFNGYGLLFQFVMVLIDGGSTMEVNCGSASLMLSDISRITSTVDRKLQISGGIPSKKKFLKKEDVLARRSGWRKLLGGETESALKLELLPASKFRDHLPMLDILPLRIVLNKSCLSLYRYFREYFAQKAVNKGCINTCFADDYKIKAFLAGIDCRQIYEEMVLAWNSIEQLVKQRRGKLKGLSEAKAAFQFLCKEIFMIISSKEFGYLPSCPTHDAVGNKTLESARLKVIKDSMENLSNFVKKLPLKKRQFDASSLSPFIIADNEQPLEDNILAKLKKGIR